MSDSHQLAINAIDRILRPLARFCLRHGLAAPEIVERLRRAFVQAAIGLLEERGEKASKARVAVMSGLSRPAVNDYWAAEARAESDNERRVHYGQRIVAAWLRDPEFRANGSPATLPLTGEAGSFEALTRRYGANMPYQTVLDELCERGIVHRGDDGIELRRHSYIPADTDADKLVLLGVDGGALLGTLEHNLNGSGAPLFERKVSFRRLSAAGVDALQQAAEAEGQPLLESLDARLAEHAEPADDETAWHAGLGIFVFVEPPESDTDKENPR